jgi:hypothetical protein
VIVVVAAMGALHNAKEEGRAELKPEIERLEATLAAERLDRARAEAAAGAYRSEMDAIRSRPVPRTPVRLCRDPKPMPTTFAPADGVTRTTTTSGGDAPAPGDYSEAGPDIGPELYALALTCDAEIAKLRALQGWVNDVR